MSAAPDAGQMFVDKKELQPVTDDARDDSNRLKSSGMNRDRTDKNAVSDDHDFGSLRGNLGNKVCYILFCSGNTFLLLRAQQSQTVRPHSRRS